MDNIDFVKDMLRKKELRKELDAFIIIDKDSIDYNKHKIFIEEHKHKDENFGAIGGHIQYILTSTSLGFFVAVKCTHCDVEEDISDYDTF